MRMSGVWVGNDNTKADPELQLVEPKRLEPKWPQIGPRGPQQASRSAQDGSETANDFPKDGPGTSPDSSMGT